MKPYLVFRLYGPMASWGLPATGQDRHTSVCPTRSAILGLLGAALGIKRDEGDEGKKLTALQQSVDIAVKQIVPTSLVRDFHTAQVPHHDKKVKHHTRKSELSVAKLNTVLSYRDYRCDALWIIAVSLTDTATVSLEGLKAALLNPVYTLYLGRKSCPLALPVQPKLPEPCTLQEALDTPFDSITFNNKDEYWLKSDGWVTYFWQGEKDEIKTKEGNSENIQTTHPWDEPESRLRWQFRQRTMHQVRMKYSEMKGEKYVSV